MKLKNIIFHGIIKLGFINLSLMIGTFYKKFGHLVEANGYKIGFDKIQNGIIADGPSYKWHAVKFSFKIFSIYLASKLEDISKKIVWIDADTICINDINESNLKQFMPKNDELMSYLGKDSFPHSHPHSETGFIDLI